MEIKDDMFGFAEDVRVSSWSRNIYPLLKYVHCPFSPVQPK